MVLEDVTAQIRELAAPALKASGLEMVDLEVVPHKRMLIRVIVDREGGVSVDDCAFLSRRLSDLFDVHDPIERAYVLEVSSPGLDRPLKKPSDFVWAQGKPVKVTIRRAEEGRDTFEGRLAGFEDGALTLETEAGEVRLDLSQVAKARLNVDPFKRD